jgi:DNA-binding GntR family transcriptional regulator
VEAHDADAARAALHRHLGRVMREFQRGVDDAAPRDGDATARRRGKAAP